MKQFNAQGYMEQYYPDTIKNLKRSLSYLKDENLRKKIEDYFLEECEKVHYNRDKVRSLKNALTHSIQAVNTPELEYDVEYLLTFFANDFRTLFYTLSSICIKTNMVLTQICSCYVRYCGKEDFEKVYKDLMTEEMLVLWEEAYGNEVRQVFEDVLDTEKHLMQEGYQKARQGETFCEICAPFCWVPQEKGKTKYKRTVPFRY